MRNSPYSRTPPAKLVKIQEIIAEGTVTVPNTQNPKSPVQQPAQGNIIVSCNLTSSNVCFHRKSY